MRKISGRLSPQFRVLSRQFLLRVVDLEALSIEADVIGFLGQFAGVLIMFSLIHAVRAYVLIPKASWSVEQYLIETMMLVVGLVTVISWDATFPDRRDVMVLAPLPVAPRTILLAKVTASAALLGLVILALNVASGIVCPLRLATQHGSDWGFFQAFAAYWITMIAASLFLYCAVLTVQGLTALLLPRRVFLRVSALLQLAAFVLFLGVYFLQPSLTTSAAMAAPSNHWVLACSPSFWFFAFFNQWNGSLPPDLAWLALRAWIGLGVAVSGAAASLLLCYVRTMKKTVEEPDLAPGAHGWHWAPRFGHSLRNAIVFFSLRSVTRSKQHRVIFAFYLSLVFSLALYCLKAALSVAPPRLMRMDFLVYSCWMMALAVAGLRGVFSLPASLRANWVLRVTQLNPPKQYIAATRRSLLLLAVLPVWLCVALLSLCFRPLQQSAAHLAVLALVGFILADIALLGISKIPFACSYLPGKSNVQYVFWGFLIVFVPLTLSFAGYEQSALHHPLQYLWLVSVLSIVTVALWAFNRHRAKSAVLYFEEVPPEIITTLGITAAPVSAQSSRS